MIMMRYLYHALVFFLLFPAFCGATLTGISPEEASYLRAHPVINVGCDKNWPPFDYFTPDNGHQGIASDYVKAVAKILDVEVQAYPDDWNAVLDMAKNGRVDMLACAAPTPQREEYLRFTKPYITIDVAVFVAKNNNQIQSIDDLRGKVVALPQGNFLHDYLQKNYPDIRLRFTPSNEEALDLVALGEVDAHIGNIAVGSYFMEANIITNVKIACKVPALRSGFSFAVSKNNPLLQKLLQRALDQLDEAQHQQIRRRWVRYFSADQQPEIVLNTKERLWVRQHHVIKVGGGSEWPPYDFRQENQYQGVARDYLDLIAKKVDLVFDYSTTDTWSGLQKKLRDGTIDLLPAIYLDKNNQEQLLFTATYVQAKEFVFVCDNNNTINSLEDLHGKRAVFVRGSNTKPVLEKQFPEVIIYEVDTIGDALQMVAKNQADFYIDTYGAVSYVSRELGLVGIKAVFPVDFVDTGLRLAVTRDKRVLFSILQKGLAAITPAEKEIIEQHWLGTNPKDRHKQIKLSTEEKLWLQNNPAILVSCDPQRAPLSFFNQQGEYAGIVADYLQLIERRTGLKFTIIHSASYAAALTAMETGTLDMIDAVGYSPERLRKMNFSNEHIRIDNVIVVPKKGVSLRRVEELAGRTVGVIHGSLVEERLHRDVPDAKITTFATAEDGLKEISQSKLDAYIIDLPTFDYYSEKLALSNLKVSGGTPYSYALHFALKKDSKQLRSIINKALASIDRTERQEIYRRWIAIDYEAAVDYSLMWKIAAALFVVIGATLYWNRRLAFEIRERKSVEQQLLIAKDAAEQATRAKSEFLANMSHDIRTPMNSVIGFADLLDELIIDPVQKDYLRSIKVGGKALLSIIDDILDLSKIEAGQLKMNYESIDPYILFSEMEQLFHQKISAKNLSYIIDIDPEIPQYLILDGTRLRQILLNLLGNAIKFTEQGSITLTVRKLYKDEQKSKLDLEIAVADTGIGIAEENQLTIFEVFEQPQGQDIRRFGGTGLGLAICKKLADLMGGKISVASNVGHGSTFTLFLPDIDVSAMGSSPQHEQAEERIEFAPATLMVVDDVVDNRKLIKAAFADSAINVIEAVHGQDALGQLSNTPVDLVFMDLRMPVLNGYETIHKIRNDQRLKDLPVIAFTASVIGEDLEKVRDFGFNGYMRKPVDRAMLFRETAKFLNHHKPHQSMPANTMEVDFKDTETLKAVQQLLQQELLPEWERIIDKGDIELIDQFCQKLLSIADQYHISFLQEYAEKLAVKIQSVDLYSIYELMHQYPQLLDHVNLKES